MEIRNQDGGEGRAGAGEGCVSGWSAPREKCYNVISYLMVAGTYIHAWRCTL